MFHHMILMCSDLSQERRIAFHKSYESILEAVKFQEFVELYKGEFKNVKFSFHHIQTESEVSSSIAQYDSYFEGVDFVSNVTTFKEYVRESVKITPEDIAKYLLVKGKYDKLQIQKLLFLIYSEYAKDHDKPLFDDRFEAWQYGPVMSSIHYKLDKYTREKIELEDIELEKLKLKIKFSRVEDIEGILECIDSVVMKYGRKTGGQLIDITHLKDSPWDVTKRNKGLNSTIDWETVKDYMKAQ